MAAQNWRAVCERALSKGIPNLMALGSMHHVLNFMEQIGVESATAGAKSEAEMRTALGRFYDKLYSPARNAQAINGDGYVAPPPGFSDDEVEASFDAFLSAVTLDQSS